MDDRRREGRGRASQEEGRACCCCSHVASPAAVKDSNENSGSGGGPSWLMPTLLSKANRYNIHSAFLGSTSSRTCSSCCCCSPPQRPKTTNLSGFSIKEKRNGMPMVDTAEYHMFRQNAMTNVVSLFFLINAARYTKKKKRYKNVTSLFQEKNKLLFRRLRVTSSICLIFKFHQSLRLSLKM